MCLKVQASARGSDLELLRSTVITNLRKDKVDKQMMSKTWWENKSNHDTDDNEETPEPATGTGLISMPRGQSERMAMCQIGQTGETLSPHKES